MNQTWFLFVLLHLFKCLTPWILSSQCSRPPGACITVPSVNLLSMFPTEHITIPNILGSFSACKGRFTFGKLVRLHWVLFCLICIEERCCCMLVGLWTVAMSSCLKSHYTRRKPCYRSPVYCQSSSVNTDLKLSMHLNETVAWSPPTILSRTFCLG